MADKHLKNCFCDGQHIRILCDRMDSYKRMKRKQKFYNKNEKLVMKRLGFKPTFASGAGEIEKEDGESAEAIAQLKSTDSESIKISFKDLHELEYHASMSRKIGIFIIQNLQTDELYAMVNVKDFANLKRIILGEEVIANSIVFNEHAVSNKTKQKVVKSSSEGRDDFYKEREEKWTKKQK